MLSRPHTFLCLLVLMAALAAGCSDDGSSDDASDSAQLEVVVDFNLGNGRLALDAPIDARQLAFEPSGNVLLADGYEVRRVDLRTGRITGVPGTHLETCADGTTAERLCATGMVAVAVDSVGRIYFAVADGRIFRIPADGGVPKHVAGRVADVCSPGHLPIAGPAHEICFGAVSDIAFDPQGRLVIADSGYSRVSRFDPATSTVTVVAGTGSRGQIGECPDDVPATETCIGGPTGIAVDRVGAVYIAATDASVRRVDPVTGIITRVAGRTEICVDGDPRGDDGPATAACLRSVEDVAVDDDGGVYVADSYDHRIRRVDPATGVITTFDGFDTAPVPTALAVDDDDRLYALSYRNNYSAREIRRFGAAPGSGETVAGNGQFHFCGDDGPARDACLGSATDVAFGPDGAMYLADVGTLRVRRIDAASGTITTVAGTGSFPIPGFTDCDPSERAVDACLDGLGALAVDRAGAVFFLEGPSPDGGHGRVRRVDPKGRISTFVGECRDRDVDVTTVPAVDACVSLVDLTLGPDGALYVAEVRRVLRYDADSGRLVTVVERAPECHPFEEDPRPQCFVVRSIALDRGGNLYITDGARVRRVDAATGAITIVAGNGTFATCGDGGPATEACLFANRIVPDAAGNLFVASAGVVRRIDAASGVITTVAGTSEGECAFNDGTTVPPDLGCASVHAIDDRGRLVYPELQQYYVGRVVRQTVPAGRPVP